MSNIKILQCGYGAIGKKLYPEFCLLCNGHIDIYDPNYTDFYIQNGYVCAETNTDNNIKTKDWDKVKDNHYNVVFICVPTPTEDGKCDTSIVEDMVRKTVLMADVVVIKSTVSVGFTESMHKLGFDNVIFSPEFSGNTLNIGTHNYVILSGEKKYTSIVAELYKKSHSCNFVIKQLESTTTAEMSKYMLNCMLAAKVYLCSEFYDACQKSNIDYDDVRDILIMDNRITPSHTTIYKDAPYYDSHCFNKDVPAFANQFNEEVFKLIDKLNTEKRESYMK